MIDRDQLALVRERLEELRAAHRRGQVDGELVAAVIEDLDWLTERAAYLADDNQRLANMVAEITDLVRASQGKRLFPVTEAIDATLGGDDEDHEGN